MHLCLSFIVHVGFCLLITSQQVIWKKHLCVKWDVMLGCKTDKINQFCAINCML